MESPEGETKSMDYGDGEAQARSFCAGTGKAAGAWFAQIEAKGIWVPYIEVKRILDSRIAHWNRQIQKAEATSEAGESEQPPADQESLTKEE